MRPHAPLLCALALCACKPEPAPAIDPTPVANPAPEPAEPTLDPRGHWIGSIALPGNQSLDWAVAIAPPDEDPDAEPVAALWIPQQMIVRMPVGAPKLGDDGTITVSLAAVDAHWTITPGDSPSCTFTQRGVGLDCDVEAVDAGEFAELMTPARPQTPKPPFPYAITEVEIANSAAPGVTLAATLTVPEGPGPHPAVVMITGSGPQDRDETLFDHKPFWVIADHLTRNGVAVLRYDDRGVGESTGSFATATTLDLASDAHAAVTWLANQPGIDGAQVGLIGHSEGGVIAPLVAADHPKDVDFIVLLAGTGVTGSEVVVHQLGLIMRAGGADEATIARQQAATRAQHRAVLDHPDDLAAAKAALERELRAYYDALPADERGDVDEVEAAITAEIEALTSPWFRHFLGHDPIPALKKVKVPVLILAGDKDLQVDPEQNLAPMKAALNKNKRVEVVRFPGLNHLFQQAKTGSPNEYATIEQTIAPEVLDRMTTWLRATAGLE